MDENKDHTENIGNTGNTGNGSETPASAEPAAKTPFRHRVIGIRGVAAVAVASVILGGAGGAALGAASSGDDNDQQRGRPGMNNGQFPGGPGDGSQNGDNRQMLPPGSNQLPPTTAPEGDES
jgi:hypothetical protein